MPKYTELELMSFIDVNQTSLNLRKSSITDEDLLDIIKFMNEHPYIKTVDLSLNYISSIGAKEFAMQNKTATSVNLSENQIGSRGAKDFAKHNQIATSVYLNHNLIGPIGAKNFAKHNQIATSVYLRDNQISDLGAKAFALHNQTATTVDLGANQISDEGAKDFAMHNKNATSVDLSFNQIGDEGAKEFAKHNKTATSVNLSYNKKIGLVGAKALVSTPFIQQFLGDFLPPVKPILDEKHPIKRANYAREVGMLGEVPSLVRLSLFAVKGLHKGMDKVISSTELGGIDDLVGVINQNII
jgi:Ran GTPase-activating protein (RanGAP) involved in mRNA processing and transport